MRYSVFIKNCTAHQGRLTKLNSTVDYLDGKTLNAVDIYKLKLILIENKSLHSSLEKNITRLLLLGLDETSRDHDDDKVFKCYNA